MLWRLATTTITVSVLLRKAKQKKVKLCHALARKKIKEVNSQQIFCFLKNSVSTPLIQNFCIFREMQIKLSLKNVFLQKNQIWIMQKIIITIDGYSGCGKSTTAKIVADKLKYIYIDSGAMYRAVTLYCHQYQIDLNNLEAVHQALTHIHIEFIFNTESQKCDTYLNGKNVEQEIRKMYISEKVSDVSKIAEVRHILVALQQKMGKAKGIVMDGRDIGTTVFPNAELKIFMTADVEVRAKRRQAELLEKGDYISLEAIIENLQTRDQIDTSRAESPLRKANDAFLLDSTHISIEEQTQKVIDLANERIAKYMELSQTSVLG